MVEHVEISILVVPHSHPLADSNVSGWVFTDVMSLTAEKLDWPAWAVDAMSVLIGAPDLDATSFADLHADLTTTPEVDSGADLAVRFGQLIDAAAATAAEMATLSARQASQIEQARELSEAVERLTRPADAQTWSPTVAARHVIVSELAAALRLPERTAESLLGESRMLMTELPRTLAALSAGEISYRHAQRLIDHASSLPVEVRRDFETAVLPAAKSLPVGKFNDTARKIRERTHPESIQVRHVRSIEDREVWVQNGRDGMASLTLHTAAADVHAAFSRVGNLAASMQGMGEDRTLTQIRADALTDLLISGVTADGLGAGVQANVQLTVPVMSLLGHSDEPAMLEGYGPIDMDTARRLAGTAPSFTRILTHPETGCVLSVGKDHYKIPKDLRRWLRVRDETCRFPGCNRPAVRSDIDHGIDWQYGGATAHDNLAHLCAKHHAMKHNTAWRVIQQPDGTMDWLSPSRRRYSTEPAIRMGPAPSHPPGETAPPGREPDPPPF
ncbi:MAG TPA: DUF222 domain-containing protein [Glaciibacter sp.]|nr:DUF222 domain-containing protein [Glaciibacter sp.]